MVKLTRGSLSSIIDSSILKGAGGGFTSVWDWNRILLSAIL